MLAVCKICSFSSVGFFTLTVKYWFPWSLNRNTIVNFLIFFLKVMMMRFHRNCYWENISLASWVVNPQKSRQWALWTRYIFIVYNSFWTYNFDKPIKTYIPSNNIPPSSHVNTTDTVNRCASADLAEVLKKLPHRNSYTVSEAETFLFKGPSLCQCWLYANM